MPDVNVTPFEIEATTRHGDVVRADVYLPKNTAGPFPVVFGASPYQKALRYLPTSGAFPFIEYGPMQLYLDNGYAYVAMDVPGTGRSEGTWDPVARTEGEAIHDMIEFVATQAWCTGNIGMIGMSYYCWSQWNAARTRPPHLKTIAAFDGATDMYRDWMYHGGIPIQGFLNSWLFGSVLLQHQEQDISCTKGHKDRVIFDMYAHPLDDEWQRRRSPFWELENIDIPVFSIGAWGKAGLHLRGNFTGFERVRGPKQLLVVEPDNFLKTQLFFGEESFHAAEMLPWYDHHLKGIQNGVMERPAVRFFVKNEDRTATATTWPPPDATPSTFYLSGEKSGHVQSLNDGSLTEGAPKNNQGATTWAYPDAKWQAGVTIMEKDGVPNHVARVNTFTTAPFEQAREFTGQGVLVLHAATDQHDLDLIVKLSLVKAGSKPTQGEKVSQGWLRASHRREDPSLTTDMRPFHAHDQEEPLEPGRSYELRVELMPLSVLVKKGDRLRLEISNHDSLIADAPMTHWYGAKVGHDTYYHNQAQPSHLKLHERPR
ncbi:MAG: CocE/NonD family hydrolase [Hymenobacter sp.]|nr:CocE/NonD family hydrolase [Hymenobacter sp.]